MGTQEMRKRSTGRSRGVFIVLVALILSAAVIGMLVIRDVRKETDVTARTTKVGLIIPGAKDDANYSQSHYDSLKSLEEDLNLKILCKESVAQDEGCAEAIEELVEKEGCRVVIAASFGYGAYVREMADRYPEVCFIQPTGTETAANLATCMGRMYQARYLAGIVAGMSTKTGEIGYAAAFPIPEVIRQINAFTLGVRSVAPDAEVHVIYINSWGDDEAAAEACGKLLAQNPGTDILTMHTDSLMPDRIAAENGIRSIGFNRDNAALFPDSYLTACVWNWEDYYRQAILSCLQGKFYGRHDWIGMEEGMVAVSALTKNCAPGTGTAVEEAKARFENRSFDVFYGPVTDNAGQLRVPEGESMSDDEMLNRFDWYVEGVTLEE
ncbi:MAG: BMP family ABC transporter substrate-binding protein [Lachnospiraceae bacterium]|nr:BMP family ABC transporter substrate-binding protein [Lachnospiraceae bacterium]